MQVWDQLINAICRPYRCEHGFSPQLHMPAIKGTHYPGPHIKIPVECIFSAVANEAKRGCDWAVRSTRTNKAILICRISYKTADLFGGML